MLLCMMVCCSVMSHSLFAATDCRQSSSTLALVGACTAIGAALVTAAAYTVILVAVVCLETVRPCPCYSCMPPHVPICLSRNTSIFIASLQYIASKVWGWSLIVSSSMPSSQFGDSCRETRLSNIDVTEFQLHWIGLAMIYISYCISYNFT